jgi:hypothetical protein
MTINSKNRTPKETFSGNAAGGLYHGTGEFLGRFCFERRLRKGKSEPERYRKYLPGSNHNA